VLRLKVEEQQKKLESADSAEALTSGGKKGVVARQPKCST
jgi:hypothetical protein